MMLSGYTLMLFRVARLVGVWRLWEWGSRIRHRGWARPLPFFDPFDTTHLLLALADPVAASDATHMEITAGNFEQWISHETRGIPGFAPASCFRSLFRDLSRQPGTRTQITAGTPGVTYFVQKGDAETIVVDVLWRRRTSPPLSRNQYRRLTKLALAEARPRPESIAAIWKDVLSRQWSEE